MNNLGVSLYGEVGTARPVGSLYGEVRGSLSQHVGTGLCVATWEPPPPGRQTDTTDNIASRSPLQTEIKDSLISNNVDLKVCDQLR